MDFDLIEDFLQWLKESREVETWDYLRAADQRIGRALSEGEYEDMVQDLLDEQVVESALNNAGFGIEESALPLRLRLSRIGHQILRRYGGRIDEWTEAERVASRPAPSGMTINVGRDVTGGQIGISGGDLSQTQNNLGDSSTAEARRLLQRALDEIDGFGLDEDEQDELADTARAGMREIDEAQDSPGQDELPSGAQRRMKKVASLLGGVLSRVATDAVTTAGNVAAHEISDGLHELIT